MAFGEMTKQMKIKLVLAYPELEWAMAFNGDDNSLTAREKQVLKIYLNLNKTNQHKMRSIPICNIPENLK